MKYTEMELKVIEVIGEVLNYDTLEANLDDNATGLEVNEVCEVTGLSSKQVRGIFSSLEKKGIMYLEECNMGATRYMQITDEGLREYYRLFESNTEKEESKEDTEMLKAIEKATGTQFQVKAIEGGFEVFTMSGEKYKKLKDSTFKKYFKIVKDSEEPTEEKKESSKSQKKAEPVEELSGDKREKMIEKIRKVLKLAQDNPSMEEGLAAALQAQKLMAKYNIHKDDVELEEVKDEISSVFSTQPHDSHLMGWRKQLGMIVARNFRCKCYLHGKDVVFRGYTTDANIAMDVFLSLYAIGHKLAKSEETKERSKTGTAKGIYNSFTMGFLKGIEEGLGEQCTALMVVVPKEVEEEYAEFSKNFKQGKAHHVYLSSSEVYEKGKVEGKAAVKARAVEQKGGKR